MLAAATGLAIARGLSRPLVTFALPLTAVERIFDSMGSSRRYESAIDSRAHSANHPPISLTDDAAMVTNKLLRRCDPPIEVRAWVAFRDGDGDRLFFLPATAEAYTPKAVFIRFLHPIGAVETTCWVWSDAIIRAKPRSLS